MQKQAESGSSLASQSSRNGKLQVQWRDSVSKIKVRATETAQCYLAMQACGPEFKSKSWVWSDAYNPRTVEDMRISGACWPLVQSQVQWENWFLGRKHRGIGQDSKSSPLASMHMHTCMHTPHKCTHKQHLSFNVFKNNKIIRWRSDWGKYPNIKLTALHRYNEDDLSVDTVKVTWKKKRCPL